MDFENYRKDIHSSNYMYYGQLVPNTACVTEFNIVMKDKVDGEILGHAAEKAAKRFPHLLVKLVKDGDELVLVHNEKPVAVKNCKDAPVLCSQETNFHLWSINYYDNKIVIYAHHGLMDGRGAMPLRSTVLYYYCKEKYDENLTAPASVRTIESEVKEEEYVSPFAKAKELPGFAEAELSAPEAMNSYLLKEDHKLSKTYLHSTVVEIPEDKFMAFCKSNGGTPNTVTNLIYAKVYENNKTLKDKEVTMGIGIDMKRLLGVSLTNESAVTSINFHYDKYKNLSFAEQNAAFRADLKKSAADENMLKLIKAQVSLLDAVEAQKGIKAKKEFLDKLLAAPGSSITVSYSGKSDWGEMEKYITAIYITPNSSAESVIEINCVAGKFFLNFVNDFTDDTYIKQFLKILEDNGVPSRIIESSESGTGKVGYSIVDFY